MSGTHTIEDEECWTKAPEGEPRIIPFLSTPQGRENRRQKKARYEQNRAARTEYDSAVSNVQKNGGRMPTPPINHGKKQHIHERCKNQIHRNAT